MRLKLIACEIFYRELCAAAARSPHTVDIEFLAKGLHDIGCAGMLARLQAAVDGVKDRSYAALLLGYGLCNNGIAGLAARGLPIVIPRAHDCITLFMGSRRRYLEYFHDHPGVYFQTTGWLERGEDRGELSQLSIQRKTGLDRSYEELVARYGQENANFLRDELQSFLRSYRQFTFIEMGVEPDDRFERQVMAEAAARGWAYEKIPGDFSLIRRLVDGEWDDRDFLVVPPGRKVRPTYGEEIIALDPE